MNTIAKKSKVKFASGMYFRPTFSGRDRLMKAAKKNGIRHGQILRDLLEKGISDKGDLLIK